MDADTDKPPRKRLSELKFDFKDYEEHLARMDRTFIHDEKLGYITIKPESHFSYDIELSRIPDFEGLIQWTHHLTSKVWMTRELVHEFIRRVCSIKGWNIYRRHL